VKADPQAQQLLLDLQAVDTTLQQLAHRRSHLPELPELERLAGVLAELQTERRRVQEQVESLDRDINRIERDVDQVRSRRERDAARLAAGSGPARELEALQHEIESLNRRQSELEDAELELMEQREQVQQELDQLNQRIADTERELADTEARRDQALAEIARQEQEQLEARKPLAGQIPSDLLTLYERIRDDTGGMGAALLRAGRCGGCRLELAGSERARIKAAPPDEVVRCEECRRILVRTAESGL
jgi:predicted  nucleic acid-binding Zn-ribbon protein